MVNGEAGEMVAVTVVILGWAGGGLEATTSKAGWGRLGCSWGPSACDELWAQWSRRP